MTLSHEYPKWIHHAGHPSVVVNDPDAEAAQLAEWGLDASDAEPPPSIQAFVAVTDEPKVVQTAAPEQTKTTVSNLGDWDGDGRPGGSVPSEKPANALTTPQPKRGGGWPKGKPRPGKAR